MIGVLATCATCGKTIAANANDIQSAIDKIVMHGWLVLGQDKVGVTEAYCNTCYGAYHVIKHRYYMIEQEEANARTVG